MVFYWDLDLLFYNCGVLNVWFLSFSLVLQGVFHGIDNFISSGMLLMQYLS